jgi:nitrite reductase/ring-hydroxylating ferredoxin subunit
LLEFVAIAKASDISLGRGKIVYVQSKRSAVAVFNIDGDFYALDNKCLHEGGPIGIGKVEDDTVECPWHGWRYGIKTGELIWKPEFHPEPRVSRLAKYEVRVINDQIEIAV